VGFFAGGQSLDQTSTTCKESTGILSKGHLHKNIHIVGFLDFPRRWLKLESSLNGLRRTHDVLMVMPIGWSVVFGFRG